MTFAPSDGLNIHYQHTGSGSPLVVIAGFTVSGLLWPASWLEPLEAHHRVLRVCNRGMGRSEAPAAGFTIADMARDAIAVLDHASVDRAAVLGWSMGGTIAQEMAALAPERVDKLVLASTWPPGGTLRPEALELGSTSIWAHLAGEPHANAEELRDLDTAFAASPPSVDVVMMQMQALFEWTGADREIAIAPPTLILHGADDVLIPVDNGRQLAKLIPHAEYAEIEGTGHMFAWEEPARTAALINAFLTSTS